MSQFLLNVGMMPGRNRGCEYGRLGTVAFNS